MALVTLTDLEDLRAWAADERLDIDTWANVRLVAAMRDGEAPRFRVAVELGYFNAEERQGSILLDATVECAADRVEEVLAAKVSSISPVVEVSLSTWTIMALREHATAVADRLAIAAERLYREAHRLPPDNAIERLEAELAVEAQARPIEA